MDSRTTYEEYVLACAYLDADVYTHDLPDVTCKYFTGKRKQTMEKLLQYRTKHDVFDPLQFSVDGDVPLGDITELIGTLPNARNFSEYYQKLKQIAVSSELSKALMRASKLLQDDATNAEFVMETLKKIDISDIVQYEPVTAGDVMGQISEKMGETQQYNYTTPGIPGLDEYMRMMPSQLIYIAARPGVGKSTLALNMAMTINRTHKVAFFSFEMSKEEVVNRLVVRELMIDRNAISREMIEKVRQTKKYYSENFLIFDAPMTVEDLGASIKLLKKKCGIEYVFIDYIGLLNTRESLNSNLYAQLTYISKKLKNYAAEFQVVVICLAQMSRDVEKRKDKTPVLSDLRDSGSLEQDANMVLFLEVAERRGNDVFDDAIVQSIGDDEMRVTIAKNRDWRNGTVVLQYVRDRYFIGKHKNY